VAEGGHESREDRHLLLPVLWAVQDRIGYISAPALAYISKRMTIAPAEVYGVASFYMMLATEPTPPRVLHVCEDIACKCLGSDDLIATLQERFGPEGAVSADGRSTWHRSPCLGQCDRGPAVLMMEAGLEPFTRLDGHRARRAIRGGGGGRHRAVRAVPARRSEPAAPASHRRDRSAEP
jgi:NADH-quinone oxidoreductase subunit F